jgi:hypothetical protein
MEYVSMVMSTGYIYSASMFSEPEEFIGMLKTNYNDL